MWLKRRDSDVNNGALFTSHQSTPNPSVATSTATHQTTSQYVPPSSSSAPHVSPPHITTLQKGGLSRVMGFHSSKAKPNNATKSSSLDQLVHSNTNANMLCTNIPQHHDNMGHPFNPFNSTPHPYRNISDINSAFDKSYPHVTISTFAVPERSTAGDGKMRKKKKIANVRFGSGTKTHDGTIRIVAVRGDEEPVRTVKEIPEVMNYAKEGYITDENAVRYRDEDSDYEEEDDEFEGRLLTRKRTTPRLSPLTPATSVTYTPIVPISRSPRSIPQESGENVDILDPYNKVTLIGIGDRGSGLAVAAETENRRWTSADGTIYPMRQNAAPRTIRELLRKPMIEIGEELDPSPPHLTYPLKPRPQPRKHLHNPSLKPSTIPLPAWSDLTLDEILNSDTHSPPLASSPSSPPHITPITPPVHTATTTPIHIPTAEEEGIDIPSDCSPEMAHMPADMIRMFVPMWEKRARERNGVSSVKAGLGESVGRDNLDFGAGKGEGSPGVGGCKGDSLACGMDSTQSLGLRDGGLGNGEAGRGCVLDVGRERRVVSESVRHQRKTKRAVEKVRGVSVGREGMKTGRQDSGVEIGWGPIVVDSESGDWRLNDAAEFDVDGGEVGKGFSVRSFGWEGVRKVGTLEAQEARAGVDSGFQSRNGSATVGDGFVDEQETKVAVETYPPVIGTEASAPVHHAPSSSASHPQPPTQRNSPAVDPSSSTPQTTPQTVHPTPPTSAPPKSKRSPLRAFLKSLTYAPKPNPKTIHPTPPCETPNSISHPPTLTPRISTSETSPSITTPATPKENPLTQTFTRAKRFFSSLGQKKGAKSNTVVPSPIRPSIPFPDHYDGTSLSLQRRLIGGGAFEI
ncbi:hypothetical protein HK097_009577 [Rhizophlyctis rosea]|uniref:Uncharacterized protein n=1 Tax=Rhizophlyctis rosea TaxID=64517 RepID=A0AAD5SB27_9FUNG|nr:hypothetical protein HK097_009577 [Rhizophlyctis rosea]